MNVEFDAAGFADKVTSPSPLWWSAPPEGTIKLNVDGSFLGSSRIMATRGLLANRDSLALAWDMGIAKLICETHSLAVIHLLECRTSPARIPFLRILIDIKSYLDKDWDVQLCLILREANLVADFLAKNGSKFR
ncbi:Ribonuclease H-like superfamily [Sesbania bispinosa]|nr:Ribonuclease H-like superfamily [Sesbania bispinosa]